MSNVSVYSSFLRADLLDFIRNPILSINDQIASTVKWNNENIVVTLPKLPI